MTYAAPLYLRTINPVQFASSIGFTHFSGQKQTKEQ